MASQAQQEIARGDYGICWGFLENQSGQSWFGHSLSCFWVRDELDDSHSFQTYLLWFYRGNMKNRIICASRQTLCFWGFIYFTNPCHEILHQQHINALIHVYKALFSIKPVFKKKAFQPWQTQNSHWKDLHRKTFTERPSLLSQITLAKLHQESKLALQIRNLFSVQNTDITIRK